ncbi:MAG: hypothetical protein AAGF12_09560 [Myxococcota bacterium]
MRNASTWMGLSLLALATMSCGGKVTVLTEGTDGDVPDAAAVDGPLLDAEVDADEPDPVTPGACEGLELIREPVLIWAEDGDEPRFPRLVVSDSTLHLVVERAVGSETQPAARVLLLDDAGHLAPEEVHTLGPLGSFRGPRVLAVQGLSDGIVLAMSPGQDFRSNPFTVAGYSATHAPRFDVTLPHGVATQQSVASNGGTGFEFHDGFAATFRFGRDGQLLESLEVADETHERIRVVRIDDETLGVVRATNHGYDTAFFSDGTEAPFAVVDGSPGADPVASVWPFDRQAIAISHIGERAGSRDAHFQVVNPDGIAAMSSAVPLLEPDYSRQVLVSSSRGVLRAIVHGDFRAEPPIAKIRLDLMGEDAGALGEPVTIAAGGLFLNHVAVVAFQDRYVVAWPGENGVWATVLECGTPPEPELDVRWENPRPQGDSLDAIWGTSDGELFIGGESTELRGFVDALQIIGTGQQVTSFFGFESDDVWVARGRGGRAAHWNGVDWTESPAASNVNTVWGTATDDVWAVGAGIPYRWDGTRWRQESRFPRRSNFSDVHGTNTNDVWVIDATRAYHFDGSTWVEWSVIEATDFTYLHSVHAAATNDVWVLGRHYGEARDRDDAFLAHWDGTEWAEVLLDRSFRSLFDIGGVAPDDLWAVGSDGVALHWDGVAWTEFETPTNKNLHALWIDAADSVFAVGEGGTIVRWDGVSWSPVSTAATRESLSGAWASAENDIWAVGARGTIVRSDGSGVWRAVESPVDATLNAVHGHDHDDAWAVGHAGTTIRWNGTEWTSVPPVSSADLRDVSVVSDIDAWAVGTGGTVLRWNGLRWARQSVDASIDFVTVWSSGGEVWAGGFEGLLHFDGNQWTEVADQARVVDIWGSGPRDVTVVRARYLQINSSRTLVANAPAQLSHFDGTAWTTEAVGESPIFALAGRRRERVGVGRDGKFVRFANGEWSADESYSARQFFNVSGAGGTYWAVGEDGAILRFTHR